MKKDKKQVVPFGSVKQVKSNRKLLSFGDALLKACEGYKFTKSDWNNKEIYGVIIAEKLMIRLMDNKLHEWIITENDILGNDWFIL